MNVNNRKEKSVVAIYGKIVSYKLICVVIGFLNSILINRCLGVALRGEYTTITNWASLLQLFLNLGIGTAYPAFKRRYPEQGKIIFSTLTLVVAIFYLVVAVVLFPFVSTSTRFIIAIALLTTVENLLIFIAIVEDVSKRNAINIVTSCIHTGVLCLVFFFFRKNLFLVLAAIIFDHLVLCCSFVYLYRLKEINFNLITKKLLKEILIIAIPAMLMNMLMYLNYHADVLFLSEITKNNVEVGLYGTAVTLGNMLWIVPDAFKDILYNRAAKKDNPDEVIIAIICNFLLCIVILIGFVILGKWFLNFMYGQEFVAAYPLVLMLFVGTLPMVLYKLIHPIYIANGKTKVVVILLAIAVASNFVGNLILIPKFEGMGAATASVISYSICGVAFYLKFTKDYSVKVLLSIKSVLKRMKK
ncbi:oligosaccharide flippase family protein [Enterococcus cecorum]|uniref:oligosaccharide flippase family protein n=1 Tax=Enterococcus cecorum TaxID=44008 RepID=UPI003F923535